MASTTSKGESTTDREAGVHPTSLAAMDRCTSFLSPFRLLARSASAFASPLRSSAVRIRGIRKRRSSSSATRSTTWATDTSSRIFTGLALWLQHDIARHSRFLSALVGAALSPPGFTPQDSERTLRLGLSDAAEAWLLPPLLRVLEKQAPHMRLIVVPVQFRTVVEALSSQRVDLAISVADELPAGSKRQSLFFGGFVCLFDPRRVRLTARPTLAAYLAQEHVIVSYNGDLRGIVEDTLGITRRVRCSVPSFSSVGSVVEGSALVATVPRSVAREIRRLRPHLRLGNLPFALKGSAVELIWRAAVDDDPACRFVREHIIRIAKKTHSNAN